MLLPAFKYFERPDLFSVFLATETNCAICSQTKRCFDASAFFGEETLVAVCPDCLASGQIKNRGVYTCEGDIEELKRQLQAIYPQYSESIIQKIARDKTAELEDTTPKLISWQDWVWPCTEGNYGRFIGFGSKTLYNRLAEGNDGKDLFQTSLYYTVREAGDPDELWEDAMPQNTIKNFEESHGFDTLFYVFKSLHSGTLVTLWDVN